MTSTLCVIGGGVIGLGLAGELRDSYDRVIVIERNAYNFRESSYAAGGMLSPFMEVEFQEEDVLQLNRRSLEQYESFIEIVRRESGVPLEVQSRGSLYVAFDKVQFSKLERLYEYQTRLGLPVRNLPANEVKHHEPLISDRVRGGLYAPDEKHINNRQLGLALYKRAKNNGVTLLTGEPVKQLQYCDDRSRISAVITSTHNLEPDTIIIAAGAWSNRLPGLKPMDRLPVRPVKGQALSVRIGGSFAPRSIVRTPDFYGVPHHPERFLIGASMEEKGFERKNKTGKVHELLDAATRALPGIRNQQFLEFWTGLRPAPRDNRPIVGPSAVTGNLYFATGHYRNGILQLPVTLDMMKRHLTGSSNSDDLRPFLPERFQEPNSERELAS